MKDMNAGWKVCATVVPCVFASAWQEAERALPRAQLAIPWVSICTAGMPHSASGRVSEW